MADNPPQDTTLLGGTQGNTEGAASGKPPEGTAPTVTQADIDAHVKSLTPEAKAEFDKIPAEKRGEAVTKVKAEVAAKAEMEAYTKSLTPEAKAEFDKLTPEQQKFDVTRAKTEAANKPPEKYEFKLPEGFKLDDEGSKVAHDTFKKLGLTQEKAQTVMSLYAERVLKQQTAQQQQLVAQQKAWRDEFNKDPNAKDLLTNAQRFLTQKATPEVATFIKGSWLGDHPGLIRLFAEAGALLKEDKTVTGKGGEGTPTSGKTAAQIIYPHLPSRG